MIRFRHFLPVLFGLISFVGTPVALAQEAQNQGVWPVVTETQATEAQVAAAEGGTTQKHSALDETVEKGTTQGHSAFGDYAHEAEPQGEEPGIVSYLQYLSQHLQYSYHSGEPVKCLTPFIIAAENAPDKGTRHDLRYHLQKMIPASEIANIEYYFSPSGLFRFQYTRTGGNAVPLADTNGSGVPDFVERAGQIADESHAYLVGTLGFRDFVVPGSFYEIRFLNINSYGFIKTQDTTTFIGIHHTFQGFPPNDDPEGNAIGAMKVTIAHEMMHAIQYVYNRNYWVNFSASLDWLEMDATMIEEIVYDEVNDYYNYIRGSSSVFRRPNGSTPVAYAHATWSLFFAERIGMDFWVDVWEEIADLPSTADFTSAMRDVLTDRGKNYDALFTENHVWHYASGALSKPGFGFQEAAFYPTPNRNFRLPVPDSLRSLPQTANPRAAQYVVLDDISSIVGEITVNLEYSGPAAGLVLIGHYPDGTHQIWQQTGESAAGGGILRISTGINWEDLRSLGMIMTNPTDSSQEMSYRIEARQLPDQLTAMPNFPNPFNSGTTIPFALPTTGYVALDVYDVTGRRVKSLIDQELNRGFYEIPFTATGFASGLYIYVLRTGQTTETGKMMLIK